MKIIIEIKDGADGGTAMTAVLPARAATDTDRVRSHAYLMMALIEEAWPIVGRKLGCNHIVTMRVRKPKP